MNLNSVLNFNDSTLQAIKQLQTILKNIMTKPDWTDIIKHGRNLQKSHNDYPTLPRVEIPNSIATDNNQQSIASLLRVHAKEGMSNEHQDHTEPSSTTPSKNIEDINN